MCPEKEVVWSINQSSPGRAFCRSDRDNKRDKTDCLSDIWSGCLSDGGVIFFPPKCGSAQTGGSRLSKSDQSESLQTQT